MSVESEDTVKTLTASDDTSVWDAWSVLVWMDSAWKLEVWSCDVEIQFVVRDENPAFVAVKPFR